MSRAFGRPGHVKAAPLWVLWGELLPLFLQNSAGKSLIFGDQTSLNHSLSYSLYIVVYHSWFSFQMIYHLEIKYFDGTSTIDREWSHENLRHFGDFPAIFDYWRVGMFHNPLGSPLNPLWSWSKSVSEMLRKMMFPSKWSSWSMSIQKMGPHETMKSSKRDTSGMVQKGTKSLNHNVLPSGKLT